MKVSTIKAIALLLFFGLIIALLVTLYGLNGQSGYRPEIVDGVIVETPRTLEPMGPATRLFERKTITLRSADQSVHHLTYFWMEPPRAPRQGEKFPLVVILHGAPGNGYAGQFLGTEPLRSRYPAYLLVPVIPHGTLWSFPEAVPSDYAALSSLTSPDIPHMLSYVASMIVQAAKSYPIDASRIYVIGCSQGGFGAFGAARDHADIFAAAVSISGGWNAADAAKLTKVPILGIHGFKDEGIPAGFTGDAVRAIQQHGGRAFYIEHANMGHQCPDQSLYGDKLWNWMFRQRKAR